MTRILFLAQVLIMCRASLLAQDKSPPAHGKRLAGRLYNKYGLVTPRYSSVYSFCSLRMTR